MRAKRGFTLIEAAVVIAVVAILSVVTVGAARAAKRNASVVGTAFDLTIRLQGERYRALNDQRDRVVVIVDASSPSSCGVFNDGACGHVWQISPEPGWSFSDFAAAPNRNAAVIDSFSLPSGIRLDPTATVTAPAPFDGVKAFETALVQTCGAVKCMAIRYSAGGEVAPVFAAGAPGPRRGMAFVLATDLQGETAAAQRYGILVGFPTGVVKSFSL
jgi:prepilin-type N-terminal cleavage/methylation domain-containing protein